MQKQIFALSFGFAALLAAAQAARAEGMACGLRAQIVAQLESRFHESRHGVGLAANNAVLEIFASQESGTFSVLVTLPSGQTCLIASGEAYQSLAEPLPVPGKGT